MTSLEIHNESGERLDHVFTPGQEDTQAADRKVVVIGHGVTSHHDRPYLTHLCDALSAAGLASLRFSFSGNGESEGRFVDSCISKEVADLGAVIDALEGWRVAYMGHSMGGAVGVMRAAADERIDALVSLAGMTEVHGFMQRHFGHLTPGEDCMLEREHAHLSESFLEDAREIQTTLPQASQISVPWLLVHGTEDELVPFEDSVRCAQACPQNAQLAPIEGADHCFTDRLDEVGSIVVPWLIGSL
ncbi:MAG: alpha/beta fold hydrolase [Planctomycetota bacterium]|jgi:pimeloyl-ACP methyl ester carboxylesterase|nr:alpha/beta hydrolase [Candidatus Woesearchaeota archaeon]MDP6384575.1 alpha/beta fold hydrolase [Planctomycetota bacterium]MDP6738794.1 alpha/beta fold hydrolase [Planctomycetota bacterium]MDP6939945.1 alpha/beta fold hydrolase [Planctomycetota bacterium]